MTTDGTDLSRRTRTAVVGVGGRFMIAPQMAAAAATVDIPSHALYLRGRVAPMGALTATAAASLMGIFPPAFVAKWWDRTDALSGAVAVSVFTDACAQWGRDCISAVPDEVLDRLADLAFQVVDAAELSALPLVAAWRSQARPAGAPARAAFALFLLRELRGAVHLGALRSCGLDVPVAIVAQPGAGTAYLRGFAWRPEEIEALQQRAAAVPDLASRWAAAEEATEFGFGVFLGILTASEADALVSSCAAVVAAVGA
jgi:hypothetical protein